MKWHHFLLIGSVVLGLNACERHSVSEYNLIKMPSEKSIPASDSGKTPDPSTPAADSKPTPGYL